MVLRVAELSSFVISPVVALKVDRRDKLDVSDFEVKERERERESVHEIEKEGMRDEESEVL